MHCRKRERLEKKWLNNLPIKRIFQGPVCFYALRSIPKGSRNFAKSKLRGPFVSETMALILPESQQAHDAMASWRQKIFSSFSNDQWFLVCPLTAQQSKGIVHVESVAGSRRNCKEKKGSVQYSIRKSLNSAHLASTVPSLLKPDCANTNTGPRRAFSVRSTILFRAAKLHQQ